MEGDMCSHARAAKAKREAQEAIDVHSKEISTDKNEGHIAIKEHFAEAYNNVARNTESRGNSKIASILMTKLGYTEAEMSVIGDDANLMQGTGNPHQKADIKSGEIIIDLGSGFGVDAFIAANKVGSSGKVIGIDISKSEIEYSQKRALERGLQDYVLFREGDIEDIPIRDSYADCVISNGGFCLVPDKNKAFEEIYRVLKNGGRMSICCTTNRAILSEKVDWPVCMNVFMQLEEIRPILERIGFSNIEVDLSNSRMDLWDLEAMDVKATISSLESEERDKYSLESIEKRREESSVHSGSERFKHLEQFDMNDLCARVIISAKKTTDSPLSETAINRSIRAINPDFRLPYSLNGMKNQREKSEALWVDKIVKSKVVFFGERHNNIDIINSQMRVLLEMSDYAKYQRLRGEGTGKVSLIMEQFIAPDQQEHLELFARTGFVSDEMKDMGGFDWEKYSKLCEFAQKLGNINFYAGFPKRSTAVSTVVKEGYEKGVLQAVEEKSLQSSSDYIVGSDKHYNIFESMISGRNLLSDEKPTDDYRRIFPAQILKDCVIARIVANCISNGDLVLCITGHGHTDFGYGIPERVYSYLGRKIESCLISCSGISETNVEEFEGIYISDLILEF